MAISAIGHIGICVSDLERSARFWMEGLGFHLIDEGEFSGRSWRRILEVGELDLRTKIIRRGHVTLELMAFAQPATLGNGERRPMHQIGMTHLAIWVDDVDEAGRRVVEYGGHLIEETRTSFDHPRLRGEWLMATDPDGIRLELIQYAEGEAKLTQF